MGLPRRPIRQAKLPSKSPPETPGPTKRPGWQRQEETAAQVTGGTATPGSGCGRRKGDLHTRLQLVECKTTEKNSISIKRDWCRKLRSEATAAGMSPLLLFGFDGPPREDWVAVPAESWRIIRQVLDAVDSGDIDEALAHLETIK